MINLLFDPSKHPLIDDLEPEQISLLSFKLMNKSFTKHKQRLTLSNMHNKNLISKGECHIPM